MNKNSLYALIIILSVPCCSLSNPEHHDTFLLRNRKAVIAAAVFVGATLSATAIYKLSFYMGWIKKNNSGLTVLFHTPFIPSQSYATFITQVGTDSVTLSIQDGSELKRVEKKIEQKNVILFSQPVGDEAQYRHYAPDSADHVFNYIESAKEIKENIANVDCIIVGVNKEEDIKYTALQLQTHYNWLGKPVTVLKREEAAQAYNDAVLHKKSVMTVLL